MESLLYLFLYLGVDFDLLLVTTLPLNLEFCQRGSIFYCLYRIL